MTDLMAVISGKPVPLADCKWVRFDPQGCAYSSSYGDAAATPEEARKRFVPRQRDRDREIRKGWTVQLLSKRQWGDQAAACFYGTCDHRVGGEAA